MTRKEKISRMLEAVEDWDVEILIERVQDDLENTFNSMNNDALDQEYIDWFGDDADIEESDDYDDSQYAQEKEEEQCTQCGKMKDVGDPCWWCGNK